jgi:hypothetical protein
MDNPETLATLGTHDTGQAIHYGDHIIYEAITKI